MPSKRATRPAVRPPSRNPAENAFLNGGGDPSPASHTTDEESRRTVSADSPSPPTASTASTLEQNAPQAAGPLPTPSAMAPRARWRRTVDVNADGSRTKRMNVRIPEELAAVFVMWCDERGESMSQAITRLVEQELRAQGALPKSQG